MKIGLIVAMSKELEALRRAGMTDVVQSGIGKAAAACTATELILTQHPDCIINSGCAGGLAPEVAVGDMVLGARTAYHDVWCGEGNLPGQVQGLPQQFDADPALLHTALSLRAEHTVHSGLICTGDWFVTTLQEDEKILKSFPEALACDMESAAIAQICHHYGVPFLSYRLISDTRRAGKTTEAVYQDFWKTASEESFAFLKQLIDRL
jgi:adenosylhomocysteine nucleosidase